MFLDLNYERRIGRLETYAHAGAAAESPQSALQIPFHMQCNSPLPEGIVTEDDKFVHGCHYVADIPLRVTTPTKEQ